uniref:Mitochondrial antiviral-signaling protein n=1 Tax=Electrophorus electricus TaxID=8005 RepID=A0A4W4E2J7_ELEEL
MAYVSDRLYRDVIVKMMARLASIVKVREIMPHLTCLTFTDKEEIEAKRETAGNYNAMVLLLDYLRRRENWPEEFIHALHACEYWALADEISNAYEQIRGINSKLFTSLSTYATAPVPVATSTTVTTATTHNVPQSSPLPPPKGPPTPIAQATPYGSVLAPETPETLPTGLAHTADPQMPISDPQERTSSPVLASEEVHSLEPSEASVSPGATPALGNLSGPPSDAAPCLSTKLLTTPLGLSNIPSTTLQPLGLSNIPSTTLQPSAGPEMSQEPVVATGSPSSLKHPIQDSNPPGKVPKSKTQNTFCIFSVQLLDRALSLGTARVSTSASIVSQLDHTAEEDENLSKPGVLAEDFPQSVEHLQELCSTTSADLMISSTTETIDSSPVHREDLPVETTSVHLISNSNHEAYTHLENGNPVVPSSNQPVEDHYESQPATVVNTLHFSENPSILNLDGCSSRMQDNLIDTNDKIVHPNHNTHIGSVIPPVICEHKSALNNQGSSGPNAATVINTPMSEQREDGLLAQLQSDPRIIAAAAAAVIGVTAVFLAWKLKYKY